MTKLPPLRLWRTLVPAALFAATVALLAKYTFPLPSYTEALLWYSRLDPLLLLSQLRAGSLHVWALLPIMLLVLTFLFGRFFLRLVMPAWRIACPAAQCTAFFGQTHRPQAFPQHSSALDKPSETLPLSLAAFFACPTGFRQRLAHVFKSVPSVD